METYKNILCITGGELIRSDENQEGMMSRSNYLQLCRRGQLRVLRRGCYGNPALIEYESLPPRYREAYEAAHGDPRRRTEPGSLLPLISADGAAASEFFVTYRFDDGAALNPGKIREYCNDAAILDALRVWIRRNTSERRARGVSAAHRWERALGEVNKVRDALPCTLPANHIALKRKFERYLNGGYATLIHGGHGNRNKVKLAGDETAEAILMMFLSHGNQFACSTVTRDYNLWAAANGRKTVSESAVKRFYALHEYDIRLMREGRSAWADKYDQVLRRVRPSAPLRMINSDDNDLDLYFRFDGIVERKGRRTHLKDDYYRYKIYVVLDAYCDYILGYAIGDRITNELIKEAYRNAMRHVKELTGSYYLWSQVVADRWGIHPTKDTELREFFERQAVFTPPTLGNARSKVIERSFGTEWHETLKHARNYAGHNVTARTKSNRDHIAANIRSNPTAEEGKAQIARFIEAMRERPWKKSGMSRRDAWLAGFRASESIHEQVISTQTYLTLFGEPHKYQSRITNGGLRITIDGNEFFYDIPDDVYRQAVGKRVQVNYEPGEMGRVLVSDGGKLRFVAVENTPVPMAIRDMKDGDRARLNAVLDVKERRRREVAERFEGYRKHLDGAMIDPQALLQAGVLGKELSQAAASAYNRSNLGADNDDILTLM